MVTIRFPSENAKRSALGRLAGRFAFTSFSSGEMLVPEDALSYLALEGISFTVEGPARYEQNGSSIRNLAAVAS
jgi:hypothetical protein